MFESLKKKLSRTSDKLEEEIIEEAKEEDNLQEEEGNKRSFFSFGRKKKEEVDESKMIEAPEEESVEEEVKEEKKSRFWSRSKDDSEDVDEDEDADEEEVKEEKKSRFWSRSKKDESGFCPHLGSVGRRNDSTYTFADKQDILIVSPGYLFQYFPGLEQGAFKALAHFSLVSLYLGRKMAVGNRKQLIAQGDGEFSGVV